MRPVAHATLTIGLPATFVSPLGTVLPASAGDAGAMSEALRVTSDSTRVRRERRARLFEAYSNGHVAYGVHEEFASVNSTGE